MNLKMMAPAVLSYCLLTLYVGQMVQMTQLSSSVPEDKSFQSFVSARVGDKVTLQCFWEVGAAERIHWFKQTPEQKPRLISTLYKYDVNASFSPDFNNPRFTLDTEEGKYHLTISDLKISDSASYFCIHHLFRVESSKSFFVSVEDSSLNIRASVKQPASETIQPGGSVTLNCAVHTGSCDGEHSIYWFKKFEESDPQLIYTHVGCRRKPNTNGDICDYNLPLQGLNEFHAVIYYCAIVSCGHIVFGNGTKLYYQDKASSLVLVCSLGGVLTFTTILCMLLGFLLHKTKNKNSSNSTEFPAHSTNIQSYMDVLWIIYSVLATNTLGTMSALKCFFLTSKKLTAPTLQL
ncbi:uncharacterized protein KZ484_015929 isoform 5-T5 [Pholidichthys leucotaenia]